MSAMTRITLAVMLALALNATPAWAASEPVHLGPSRALVREASTSRPAPPPSLYPVITSALSVRGKNPVRVTLKMPLGRPVCIVGYDSYSLAWLKSNASKLSRGGALCYAVNVPNANALHAMRVAAPTVPLAPISGEVFVLAGLRGYPALITQSGMVR
jgi:integrating conjugative element protein (TIGR03765 family)